MRQNTGTASDKSQPQKLKQAQPHHEPLTQSKAHEKSPERLSVKTLPRSPMTSNKLGRTIEELEHAFSDWESLSESLSESRAGSIGRIAETPEASSPAALKEEELRQKTKKLLGQLRQQLNELNE